MKKTFISTYVLMLAVNLVSYFFLPSDVAIHFGRGGRGNSWASKEVNFFFFLVIEVVLFLLFYYSPILVKKTPQRWLNIPNKEYWLKEENMESFIQSFSNLMYQYGIAMAWLFIAINFLTVEANLSQPVRLNEKLFLTVMAIFMVYTVYWTIKVIRSYKIPGEKRN